MPNVSNLTITITGSIGSGKTTLTFAIFEFLQSKGFTDLYMGDMDILDPTPGHDYARRRYNDKAMESIKNNSIDIVTAQTRYRKNRIV